MKRPVTLVPSAATNTFVDALETAPPAVARNVTM
jgi:hypothetical protein